MTRWAALVVAGWALGAGWAWALGRAAAVGDRPAGRVCPASIDPPVRCYRVICRDGCVMQSDPAPSTLEVGR